MSGSAPTAFALPFVFAGLTVLAVGTAILLRERFSRLGWLHFLLSSTIGAWQLTTALEFLSTDLPTATVWARLTTLFVLAIPALQYHFASVITGRWRRQWRGIAGAWLASMLLLVVHLAGQMQAGVVAYSWGYYPLYAPAGWVFVVFTVVVVSLCIGMYWRLYRGNRPGGASHPGVVCCCCPACWWARSARSISCRRSGVGLFPLGGLAVTLGNLINAYTTWKYRLFEITPAYAADQLMDSMSDGVVLIDRDGVVRLVNPSACEILGIDRASLLSRLPPTELAEEVLGWQHVPFFPSDDTLGEREYRDARRYSPHARRQRGASAGAGLEPGVAVITLRDITAAVRAQEQIERLAYYDSLTHLPNRLLLRERLRRGTCPRAPSAGRCARRSSWTWTASSRSTTHLATTPAMCCSRAWPNASRLA